MERKRDGAKESKRKRGRDMVTHSSHAASSFDSSSKGGLKSEHFCTLTHTVRLWPFKEPARRKKIH